MTKNGYGELVVMSQDFYRRNFVRNVIDAALEESEESIRNGEPLVDGFEFLDQLEEEYGF